MLARDSVILLVSATKMVRIYMFTSSLVRYRRIEAKNTWDCQELRCFYKSHPGIAQIGYSFGKHCWTENSEDDYIEQKYE